ncbi:hypothetical protein TCAL_01670 [Tigriopus californicus]|uniref:Selenoprotein F/M domain-containing protein n=1 Tax=Tigriopus californicus TaxID=6832 RepID=A0A553PC38_TIGCA|nr:hypothetical protein TCAL_01670 [Tigriopus californicus]|eukprot:TCALIF_01670-PA protein Name:"Protein of unknown function" AED:0.28 eAED:0.28 QI:0/-1/0/1/-1/1/1/0/69
MFIEEDFQSLYPRTSVRKVPRQKSPELIFSDSNHIELERIDISGLTRQELKTLMKLKGFQEGHQLRVEL